MNIDKLGIYGCGNVGSMLVMELAGRKLTGELTVASRNIKHSEAAILDAASAHPEQVADFKLSQQLEGDFDIVVVTAGLLPHEVNDKDELLAQNIQIIVDALVNVRSKTIVIIGTPIDRVTQAITAMPQFTNSRVIGFGGQLDENRTRYALKARGIDVEEPIFAIGEHGPRTIPFYSGEENYEEVRAEVGNFLKRVTSSGKLLNLATGVQLANLLEALAGEEKILCISQPDPDFHNLSITWPYKISGYNIEKVNLNIESPLTKSALDQLIKQRVEEK